MLQFETFDDILDFAIVQEKAAQKFYGKLSDEAESPQMAMFYRTLEQEERVHEEKLQELRSAETELPAPDLTDLEKSGYLKALPLHAGMSLKEVYQYAMKKERSAKMLYSVLAGNMPRKELADLFEKLAAEEAQHAEFFRKEYETIPAEAD
ncbi:MAG: ferritin family protein [Planctomycetes bacterium]|nr:ferritin family protein [Planctomycetota bacterium]